MRCPKSFFNSLLDGALRLMHLTKAGYLAMGSQIVDASLVPAPKQIPWAGSAACVFAE